jgi:COP9 signalosome complex subunit 2
LFTYTDYGSDEDQEDGNEGDEEDDELIEIENSFYEGDDIMKENPQYAVELFEKVVKLETSRGDEVIWRFKALQKLVKVHFILKEYIKMIQRYRDMLIYMSEVTRNECTESINVILDTLLTATDPHVLSEMYEITLEALKSAKNERLWFNTNLKLAKLYMDGDKISEAERILQLLKKSCQNSDGTDDMSKGSLLLEAYCLEIQLCSATRDAARMRRIYPNTLNMNDVVSDPRIMGLIREEGGKMYMSEGLWIDAYNELYEAFRNYQVWAVNNFLLTALDQLCSIIDFVRYLCYY